MNHRITSPSEKAIFSAGDMDNQPFSNFLEEFQRRIRKVYRDEIIHDREVLPRGVPEQVIRDIMALNPLSVCIPRDFGGRGGDIGEILRMLSAASYESLALSLTLGINSGLFIQPIVKYAKDEVKRNVFTSILQDRHMGGLMITEPGFGTDALNIQTSYTRNGDEFRLTGIKHWAGLTGFANYWLLTAREATSQGDLRRDIDFFVCDTSLPGQQIVVEELFDNLGLHQIPYGRNRIEMVIPASHRLEPKSTGIKLMLDLLHRSRLHFPGMALGFIHRMLDEATDHCRQRSAGGQTLIHYDQVQQRLARLQASFTIASAMCRYSSQHASLDNDLSASAMVANSMKSFITDLMQEAAQSLVQLTGARAYRFSHIGGRGIIDSRPFQIFEGSNDMLYAQVGEGLMKRMKKNGERSLFGFLRHYRHTEHAAKEMEDLLHFNLHSPLPQRKLVELGKLMSRIIAAEMVLTLGGSDFRQDLADMALIEIRHELAGLIGTYQNSSTPGFIEDYHDHSTW